MNNEMFRLHFSRNDMLLLDELIETSSNILEYGSGASTIYAYSKNKRITTVETSLEFLNEVLQRCHKSDLVTGIYADVGKTAKWGYSISLPEGFDTINKYSNLPWKDKSFDLVINDGRFRVATFMISWNNANPGTKFYWDDFKNRSWYHEVLDIAQVTKYGDNGAMLVKDSGVTFKQDIIEKYLLDQR